MKATPGCGSIRVWLHFELIFLSLESRTPILLLIAALIHNRAHPIPPWNKQENIKQSLWRTFDSVKKTTTGKDFEVIRVHHLRICSQTVVSRVSSFLYWSVCLYCSLSFIKNIYSALYSFGLGCVYTWQLIDFPDSRKTSHLSCSLCLPSPTEAPPLWMKFSSDLWLLGSAFVSSPVTTNNSWIAVNVSAAASPPSPLWTIGLHSTCTNGTLSWELHYQLCCIWFLKFPSYDASINRTTVIKQRGGIY